MTFDFVPPRVLGIVGIIIFWQMFYGTAVYFFQFVNNRRYKGHSLRDLLLFVGGKLIVQPVVGRAWWALSLMGVRP